ncbi:MAG: outer membrane protein assembly factor BamA [Deltaproteobacteria bacterium]|nr:MAG: outer membrane protein assembly factor BamA [Deltaproteobacteria bacterium]
MKFKKTLALIALLMLTPALAYSYMVNVVEVRGNLRTPEGAIVKEIKTTAGSEYDEETARGDIKALYATGLFSEVAVARDEQGIVTFLVRENPALNKWTIEGDDKYTVEDLAEEMPLKREEIIREGQLLKASEVIRGKYHEDGYFLARVTPEETRLDDGKNRVDVTFKVIRGEKVRIHKIKIPGVEDPGELEDLYDGFKSSEKSFWSWLTDSGAYNPDEIQRDAEFINYYYLENGHALVVVGKPLVNLSPDMSKVRVDIPVEPGPVFTFGPVRFSGDSDYTVEEMAEAVKVKGGDIFTTAALREGVRKLKELLGDRGYAFAEVSPLTSVNQDARVIDLEFRVDKGDPATVGRIEIVGNTTTRDRVVRRDIYLVEGELYNGTNMTRSKRKVNRTGLFEKADFDLRRRPGTSIVDLDVKVTETTNGSFSVGGGYSSLDGLIGMVSLSHRNVFGYGYQLSLDGSFGTSQETYSLNFNNPRLFDSDVYFGISLYKSYTEYSEYSRASQGFSVKTGLDLNDDWSTRLTYAFDDSSVYDVCTDEDVANGTCFDAASISVQEQEGQIVTASLTPMLTYDTRNNQWDASDGSRGTASVTLAGGPLGQDAQYMQYKLKAKKYVSLPWDTIFTASADFSFIEGINGEPVPIYELYALGGIYTMRGFGWRDIGPKDEGEVDPVTGEVIRESTGEVIGGDKYALFNFEYLVPVIKEAKLKAVFFLDAGNVWDVGEDFFSTELRYSVGTGIRWFSPLGPLRLEYGYIIDPKEGEDTDGRWEFSIGGFF